MPLYLVTMCQAMSALGHSIKFNQMETCQKGPVTLICKMGKLRLQREEKTLVSNK